MYYISLQSLLLQLSPQRLIGVDEAENRSDLKELIQDDGDRKITFSNPEDHMDFEKEQIVTDIGGEFNEKIMKFLMK